jgi:hypothetical protein
LAVDLVQSLKVKILFKKSLNVIVGKKTVVTSTGYGGQGVERQERGAPGRVDDRMLAAIKGTIMG